MTVQSVLGPIDTQALGTTLMHEHVSCADWSMRMNFGNKFFEADVVEKMAAGQLSEAKKSFGITTIVDGTPINLGRDINLIKAVAKKSGVNIIASSGFYYQEEPWLLFRDEEQIYDLMLHECQNGIAGTDILPGMLKAGVSELGITPLLHRLLQVTGRVASKTGLNIFCHHDPKLRNGDQILAIFESCGVSPGQVILGHSGDSNELDYLEAMLKRGCWLGMDRFGFCHLGNSLKNRVNTIIALCEKGYSDRLLLSHDLAAYLAFWDSWETSKNADYLNLDVDFTFIHKQVLPALRAAGFGKKQTEQLLTDNPRHFFEQ